MESLTSRSYQEALARRREMEERLTALERAVAAATAAPDWALTVRDRLGELNQALVHHMVAVEAPDGLLAEIQEAAPRLSNDVQRMRDDHGAMAAHIEKLINQTGRVPVDDIRDEVVELIHSMMLHRQRGSDLVYEAFTRDIGGLDS